MKILVTGCAGFIGFNLVKKLLNDGHTITGIDNINNYYDQNLKLWRLAEINSKNFTFVKLDINNIQEIDDNFDLLINLAAQAGVRVPKKNRDNYIHSNIDGYKNVVSFCINKNIKRVIYASSSSVYSDLSSNAFSESETDLEPKSLYGETKLFNETYSDNIDSSVNFVGLRFFSVYGPFGRPDMAYFSFTESIKKGKIIKLHNNGNMARDMTFIDDAVDGIKKSIDFLINNETNNEIFNIGNDSPILTLKLLETLESNLNIRAKVENLNVINESLYTHANLEKSKDMLGYNPKVIFEDGIKEFLNWHNHYESN